MKGPGGCKRAKGWPRGVLVERVGLRHKLDFAGGLVRTRSSVGEAAIGLAITTAQRRRDIWREDVSRKMRTTTSLLRQTGQAFVLLLSDGVRDHLRTT
jgi:hypothetical protein